MLANFRGMEWIILLVIVLLLFGARRLPDLARSLGKSMKILRSEVKDIRKDDTTTDPAGTTTPTAPVTEARPTSTSPGAPSSPAGAGTGTEPSPTGSRSTAGPAGTGSDDGDRPH
ncbi:Sec-independent protein translocase subunit TatA [Actinotalea sp. C106]|uniref:Sec-independent protein translocase subunit TatA n=1 Tax=Actinotalea sp. C106 TaxID=2908644 RepID=UPI002028C2DF|nr:Sec-independent protein translocase subunit TatA [Actinotalea sp. C106]